MAKLSAASRLREQVLSVPNTVLLIGAGHPDKVLRFNRLPDTILQYRKMKASEKSESDLRTVHTPLDLDRGPDQEVYRNLVEEIRKNSRRDIPAPDPIPVAGDSSEEWSVGLEDVPVVELNALIIPTVHAVKEEDREEVLEPVAAATGFVDAPKKRGRPRKTE